MNSQIRRETAQILQFPPPGLRARAIRSFQANAKQRSAQFELGPTVSTGAWYHDAAIAETDRTRKP
jgi:hypothetical protein